MSAQEHKGFLPEGGEMLILGIVMFAGVIGLIILMYNLAPTPS